MRLRQRQREAFQERWVDEEESILEGRLEASEERERDEIAAEAEKTQARRDEEGQREPFKERRGDKQGRRAQPARETRGKQGEMRLQKQVIR